MIQMHIIISEDQYHYLQQRAQKQGASLDQVVSELIAADIEWQHTLADDPMCALFGQVDDSFAWQDIDSVVYGFEAQ